MTVQIVHAAAASLAGVPPPAAAPPAQAVERALAILELFDERRQALGIGEIAADLGVHRSTASRMVAALVRHRLLEPTADGRAVQLGLGLVSLAGHVLRRFPVQARGREEVQALRDATGETAWLAILDGDEVVYLEQAAGGRLGPPVDWTGRRQRLTAGVTGAVLLAFQRPEVVAELLREAHSEGEPAARDLTVEELARVRERGHLARYEDALSGHAVVAAPVRDDRGEVVAAVTLSGSPDRLDRRRFAEELVPATCRAALRISEGLGHAPR
jgi:DNA-binding IclR family transcriptional regulator